MLEQFSQQAVRTERERDFDQPVINIGSHPDNDIMIPGQGVYPFHALVVVQGNQRDLVSLTPEAEIRVDGILLDEPSTTITRNQRVEIGGYTLRFQENGSPSSVRVSILSNDIDTAPLPSRYEMMQGEEAVLVNVISQVTDIEVQQSAILELEVVNAGPIVASFYVTLQGVPEDWVEIRQAAFNLNEGQRALVNVLVTPPREPTSTAGRHDISIIVSSPNYPGHEVLTPFELTIQPYYEFALGNLSPKQQRIPWRKRTGLVHLPITNRGNSATDFIVSALDDENGCSFDFRISEDHQLTRQATVSIESGGNINLPIDITPLKQAVFALRSKRYHFTTTVQVPQQISSPQTISASVTSLPLFGWWSIMLGILVILLGLFILLQPRIHSFQLVAGKDVIELGDTTKLEWSVSPFATRLGISNIDQTLNRGQKTLTVAPSKSTTYELVAGNWLSGLLGLDRKESQTVLVIPPSPNIGVFEVDKTTVDKGAPVNLRWSVTQADQVFLTVDEVVYELPQDQFSGEQEYILENDALLTLEAVNTSGSELRSYFVNVVPPHITVNAFTVWTRSPETASNTQDVSSGSGGGHFASRVFVPDANFPEEYVMLIPDQSSDSGYRVEFLQPDRELAKGEQIMLEWDIEGVESVQISPFTEELPNRGVQPFFPQESMNFVMTAKSGELEQIYMLPVKVFDGIPPEAPTIEFFKASPLKMVGAGPVEFAWSVSGEWTRVQLASGDAVVADYLNPQGFKTVNVSKSSTFILTAWNGADLSSAAPVEITVDPALIPLPLWIERVFPDTGRFLIGDKIKVTVDYDKPDDKPDPTGEIIVTDGASICTITLPAKLCDLVFETPGTKSITAVYTGDTIYLQSSSDPYTQTIEVQSAQVDLTALYYFLNDDSTKGSEINDIQKTTLTIDEGLYATIVVQPKNTVLPLDDSEKISASVCDQNNNCEFVAVATVRGATPNTDEIVGYGYADIVIPNFTSAGLRDLLFEYRQEDGAIDPATLREEDITIGRLRISLALEDCIDPDQFDTCRIGVKDPSDVTIIFDIKNYNSLDNNGDRLPLSSVLPKPISGLFELQWEESPGVLHDWVCTVIVKNARYKLECDYTGPPDLPVVSPVIMIYSYNNSISGPDPNNYFMGGDPDDTGVFTDTFDLYYLRSTEVKIKNLSSLKVGQKVLVTNNISGTSIISILDANGVEINNNTLGDVTLLETNGLDIFSDADLVEQNCTIVNKQVVIKNPGGICEIYFKKAGDFSLQAIYAGDLTYSGNTSGTTQVTINQQNEITTTWKVKSTTNYVDWVSTWNINQQKDVRVELSNAVNFSAQSLVDRVLTVRLEEAPQGSTTSSCKITTGGTVTGTSDPNEYKVVITFDSGSGEAVADFPVRCTSEGKMVASIAFASGQDATDFTFDPNALTERSVDILQNSTASMMYTLIRTAGNKTMNNNDIFHVGEEYNLQFTISNLWEWYDSYYGIYYPWRSNENTVMTQYTNNDYVKIEFPSMIKDNWDTAKTTCDDSYDPIISRYKVRLNQSSLEQIYRYYWFVYEYGYFRFSLKNATPCKLVFVPPNQSIPDSMIFNYNSTVNAGFTASSTYQFNGLQKQAVTMSFTPLSSQTNRITRTINTGTIITIDLAPEIPQTTSQPLTATSDLSVVSTCGGTATKQINTSRQAQITITTSQPGDCSVTVEYSGNAFFNPVNTNNVIYLHFEEPPTPTDTTLNITPNPSTYGGDITFAGHVTLESGTAPKPTGSVQFQNYGVSIGAPIVLDNQQWARLVTNTLQAGTYLITAVYIPSPSSNFEGSESSPAQNLTINKAGTQTTLSVSHSPTATTGITVTFTAMVTSPSALDPTGKVEFWDQIPNPDVKLGESQLSSGAASFSTPSLSVGNHTVVAIYISVPANFVGSTSTGKDIEIVN